MILKERDLNRKDVEKLKHKCKDLSYKLSRIIEELSEEIDKINYDHDIHAMNNSEKPSFSKNQSSKKEE